MKITQHKNFRIYSTWMTFKGLSTKQILLILATILLLKLVRTFYQENLCKYVYVYAPRLIPYSLQ